MSDIDTDFIDLSDILSTVDIEILYGNNAVYFRIFRASVVEKVKSLLRNTANIYGININCTITSSEAYINLGGIDESKIEAVSKRIHDALSDRGLNCSLRKAR